jgi:hypothetical protein
MDVKQAYAAGFTARCEKAGVDPDAILKFAKVMYEAPSSEEQAQFKAKVTGKPAGPAPKAKPKTGLLERLTSSGTKGSQGEIAKKQQLKRDLAGD